MALSNKQRKFINEYLQCFNATEAARLAGYSPKTARAIGAENLTKPDIAAEIEKALNESAMSASEVLMRLAEQARNDELPNHQLKALELLAKHHGLLTDVLKVKVENELNSALDLLEKNLEPEAYERIITIFAEAGQK
jgi:phage terminase small subunit